GLSQCLLVDSPPDTGVPATSPQYWSTFQTGLEFNGGQPKPSFAAYRVAAFLPSGGALASGRKLAVWAMLRAARNGTRQRATIQWSADATTFKTIATASTSDPSGILQTRVAVPGSGVVRVGWSAPGGTVEYSRNMIVTVR